MYSAVLFVGVNNASTIQPIVAIERTVFYREYASGMYSALPYAIAQVRLQLFSAKFSKLEVDKYKNYIFSGTYFLSFPTFQFQV